MNYWDPEGYYRMNEGDLRDLSAAEAIERMKVVIGARTDHELAEWMGTPQAWITDARRRNIILLRWLHVLGLVHTRHAVKYVLGLVEPPDTKP